MALYLLRDWMNDMNINRPSRLVDQQFGMGITPDDLLNSLTFSPMRPLLSANYWRPWRLDTTGDTGSTVQCDKNKFQVNLDVQQFKPEEIKVKVIDDSVVVEAKHEEKEDEHGYISRQFVRRYVLPKGYEIKGIQSSLSSDGVLTISAPKSGAIENHERMIPITSTGPHNTSKESEKIAETK